MKYKALEKNHLFLRKNIFFSKYTHKICLLKPQFFIFFFLDKKIHAHLSSDTLKKELVGTYHFDGIWANSLK